MKLYLFPNGSTDSRRSSAIRCVRWFTQKFDCAVSPEDLGWLAPYGCRAGGPEESDLVVSVGGDGTALRAASIAMAHEKPLLGINVGHKGFLCALHEADLPQMSPETIARLTPTRRTLLGFTWEGHEYFALNDVVLGKSDFGTTLDVTCKLDGRFLTSWQGDGALAATPTGSSAYNLSAGGPMLLPSSACFVVTPLCPMGRQVASIVIPDTARVTLSATPRNATLSPCVYADGVRLGEIHGELTLQKYARTLTLLSPTQ